MKIEDVKTYLVQDWLLVQITTDSGIVGVGQGTFWGQPAASEQALLSFKSYLIGKNPLTIDYHYQYLNRSSSFRASAIYAALSAIDSALWDIAGKHYGAPAYALMGGKHREKIRMCALCMSGYRDEAVRDSTEAVRAGHTAVKIDPFPPEYANWTVSRLTKEVTEHVGAVREAVGPDVDIAVEVHRKLGPSEAIAVARRLEQFDILFLEDPVPPDSIQSMAEVAARVNVPVSTGERLHSMYEFKEVLSSGAARDLKLDVGLQGGLSQCKKIAGMAEAYHATVSPHNARGPVLTAGHVQLAAAIPNFLVLEYRPDPKDDVVTEPMDVKDGYIAVPDTPGIGVELDEAKARSYVYSPGPVGTLTRNDGSVGFR
jgi:galactonate dehydratase